MCVHGKICEQSRGDLTIQGCGHIWEGTVSRTDCLADARFRRRGWSNCELAQFHRMIAILCDVGSTFETDCGVTDEGEPWLVFCEADSGEMFAHFARIGG